MGRYRVRADELALLAAGRRSTSVRAEEAWPPDVAQASWELRPRQLEVLRLIADGFSNGEIAERLGIGSETVKGHIRELLVKLRADSRAHAVAIGFRQQLLS
jgi:DNA-binding CsgD family transcriptional regulator